MTTLTVAEAIQMDVGRSIARLSSDLMENLNLESGQVIEITGKKQTVATVWRSRPEDATLNVIRIDGTIRHNAGCSIGEQVTVKQIKTKPATSITLSPLQEVKFSSDPTDFFKQRLLDKPFIKGMKITIDVMGRSLHYAVNSLTPKGAVTVTSTTKLAVSETPYQEASLIPDISYEDIGGLQQEIEQIREMIELPIKHPEVFQRLGIGAPKGVLLTGPPGTGKTLLAKAVASETEANFYSIAGPEIVSKFYGESEKQLRSIFEEANKNAPSIIFIDEIDSIAPNRSESQGEVERRMVSQLLTLLDGLQSRGQVVVIGATNRQDAIDPALRRPGRFDRELVVGVPDEQGRHEILQIHTRGMPLAKDVKLPELAMKTLGFTGADLESLCKEAALKSIKKYVPDLKQFNEKVPSNVLEKIQVKKEHFDAALQHVEPSAMREVLIQRPKTTWQDIGGLEAIKEQLKEAVIWPMEHPEHFKEAGIRPPKGILLHGVPGTGKTLIAKALANEARANFISVKGPELISKWVGESEKHIRQIFKRARQVAPAVIFFDEFDAISSARGQHFSDATERIVNQLLTEMDGIEELEKVIVVAATNRADLIDPGLMRPGRIDLALEIPLPDKLSRKAIFMVHTKSMPTESIGFDILAQKTEKASGADIEGICREAGMQAIREARKSQKKITVTNEHFQHAINAYTKKKKQELNPLTR